jgi:hypothetical protein
MKGVEEQEEALSPVLMGSSTSTFGFPPFLGSYISASTFAQPVRDVVCVTIVTPKKGIKKRTSIPCLLGRSCQPVVVSSGR